MAESTISISTQDLWNEVGRYFNLGNTSTVTSADDIINRCVKRGLIQFYYPPLMPGEQHQHEWSFLKPTRCIRVFPTVDGPLAGRATYTSASEDSTVTAGTATTPTGVPTFANADDFLVTTSFETPAVSYNSPLVGQMLTFRTSCNKYEIKSVTSVSALVVHGDASGEIAGHGTGSSFGIHDATNNQQAFNVAAGSTSFSDPNIVAGMYIQFDATENAYPIKSITDSDTIVIATSSDINGTESGTDDYIIADQFEIYGGDYALPDDFAGICGDLTFSATTGFPPVEVTSEVYIRQQRMDQRNILAFRPRYAAVRPRDLGDAGRAGAGGLTREGQRFELMLWPVPDTIYTLEYRSRVVAPLPPDIAAPANDETYPLGGGQYGEVMIASCLAIAETVLEPTPPVFRHQERFLRLLAGAVAADRQNNRADFYGYNDDRSDSRELFPTYRDLFDAVTVNGTLYP